MATESVRLPEDSATVLRKFAWQDPLKQQILEFFDVRDAGPSKAISAFVDQVSDPAFPVIEIEQAAEALLSSFPEVQEADGWKACSMSLAAFCLGARIAQGVR